MNHTLSLILTNPLFFFAFPLSCLSTSLVDLRVTFYSKKECEWRNIPPVFVLWSSKTMSDLCWSYDKRYSYIEINTDRHPDSKSKKLSLCCALFVLFVRAPVHPGVDQKELKGLFTVSSICHMRAKNIYWYSKKKKKKKEKKINHYHNYISHSSVKVHNWSY